MTPVTRVDTASKSKNERSSNAFAVVQEDETLPLGNRKDAADTDNGRGDDDSSGAEQARGK